MPSSRNPNLGMSRDSSDFRGLSPVETRKGSKKPPGNKRARSLDRQAPRKDPESSNSRRPSSPTCRRTASDGARSSENLSHFAEAQGAAAAAAAPLGEGHRFLPREQGPPEDTKKEKPPREAEQSFWRIVMNLLLMRMEEPREKASRMSKGNRGDLSEATEEPAPRKKSQDKRTSRKKHSHRKPVVGGPPGPQTADTQGQEDMPPSLATSRVPEEGDPGLICRGGPDSDLPQALPTEGGHAETPDSSGQAAGPPAEEDPRKPNEDDVIWQIVELLKKAGDQLEEEQAQVPQPEAVPPQKPTPPPRKKSQEKKSSLKRALSLKKPASEEPKRVGGAATTLETRPKRPSFLPLCVSSPRTSTSSSYDLEVPAIHEVPTEYGEGSHPSDHPPAVVFQGPEEKPLLDRASESREFRRKILALLQNAEEEREEQQEAEENRETRAPAGKVKSQGKKSNLRRAFSLRKHSPKDSKRTEALGTPGSGSPEGRPHKRHGFLPMCVSGHRASFSSSPESLEFQKTEAAGGGPAGSPEAPLQARSHTPEEGPSTERAWESKEFMIQRLVASLQEVDSELGRQIRKYPSFRRFFNDFSDTSLRKLVATLDRQKARLSEEGRRLANRPPPCDFVTLNKFAANHSCAICTLMQSRGEYKGHSYAHFLSRKAQQDITKLDSQSPD
ncbi:protein BNIP5 [Apodemus sylvaticus]|uniref:protein BNIP5 n=1 Tax=Apodemus sylvaticus TaxID=10129 RepID=UPI002243A40E|nr:protein BNIP5 [Apodemus sylvaticus]